MVKPKTKKMVTRTNDGRMNGLVYRVVSRDPFKPHLSRMTLKENLCKVRSEISYQVKILELDIIKLQAVPKIEPSLQKELMNRVRQTFGLVAFYHKSLMKYLKLIEPSKMFINELFSKGYKQEDFKIFQKKGYIETQFMSSFSKELVKELKKNEVTADNIFQAKSRKKFQMIQNKIDKKIEQNKINLNFFSDEFFICLINSMRIAYCVFITLKKKEYARRMLKAAYETSYLVESRINAYSLYRAIFQIYLLVAKEHIERKRYKKAYHLLNHCITLFHLELSFLKEQLIQKKYSEQKVQTFFVNSIKMVLIAIQNIITLLLKFSDLKNVFRYTKFGESLAKEYLNPNSDSYKTIFSFCKFIKKKFWMDFQMRREYEDVLFYWCQKFNLDKPAFYLNDKINRKDWRKKTKHLKLSKSGENPLDKLRNIIVVKPDQISHPAGSPKKRDSLFGRYKSIDFTEADFQTKKKKKKKLDIHKNLNYFIEKRKIEKHKKSGLEKYYLKSKKLKEYKDEMKNRVRDTFGRFFYLRGLKDKEEEYVSELSFEEELKFAGYIDKDQLQKQRAEYLRKKYPSEIDPYFLKLLFNDINDPENKKKIKILNIDEIKLNGMVHEYYEKNDKIELKKLKDFLQMRNFKNITDLDFKKRQNKKYFEAVSNAGEKFDERLGIELVNHQAQKANKERLKIYEKKKSNPEIKLFAGRRGNCQDKDKDGQLKRSKSADHSLINILEKNKKLMSIDNIIVARKKIWKQLEEMNLDLKSLENKSPVKLQKMMSKSKSKSKIFKSFNQNKKSPIFKFGPKMQHRKSLNDQPSFNRVITEDDLNAFSSYQRDLIKICLNADKNDLSQEEVFKRTKDMIQNQMDSMDKKKWYNSTTGKTHKIDFNKKLKKSKPKVSHIRSHSDLKKYTDLAKSVNKVSIFTGLQNKISGFSDVVNVAFKLKKNNIESKDLRKMSYINTPGQIE